MSFRDYVRKWLGISNNEDNTPISTPEEIVEFLLRGGLNKSISGESVTPDSAMQVAAVNAAVRVISRTIAAMPLHLMRNIETDFGPGREKATNHPLYKLLLRRPNQWQTAFEFKSFLQREVLLRGNGYALITRRGSEIKELIPIQSHRVRVKQDDQMRLKYLVTRKDGGQQLEFSQRSIFHLRDLSLDGIVGVSPLTWARETIGGALALQRHGSALFGNGANPSSVLKHPKRLTPEARDNLQESIDEQIAGDRQNSMLILEEGMELEKTSMTQEDAQFLETNNFKRSEIAAIYNLPPHKVGDLSRATFSNIEAQNISFVIDAILPWAVIWEQAIQRDMIAPSEQELYFAKLQLSALLRGDTKTRGEFYVKMKQNGIFSANEIRELEDRNPREGGDEFTEPLNMGSNDDEPDQSETEPDDEGAGGETNPDQ